MTQDHCRMNPVKAPGPWGPALCNFGKRYDLFLSCLGIRKGWASSSERSRLKLKQKVSICAHTSWWDTFLLLWSPSSVLGLRGPHSKLHRGRISSSRSITYSHGWYLVSLVSQNFDAIGDAINDTVWFTHKGTCQVFLRHTHCSSLITASLKSKASRDLTHHQFSRLVLRKS